MKLSSSYTHALLSLALLGTSIVAACGGTTPAAESPTSGETSAASEPQSEEPAAKAPAKSFDDMSPPERMELMKTVVVPEMTQAFQAFDADEFDKVNCATCHGPGAKQGDFSMPSKALPALDKAEMDEHPEMTKFMMETVVPKMAAILGEAPYNPETHEGFGCFHCHTKKE